MTCNAVLLYVHVERSCFLFELSPEHSPNSTYMNLTEDEEREVQFSQFKAGLICDKATFDYMYLMAIF